MKLPLSLVRPILLTEHRPNPTKVNRFTSLILSSGILTTHPESKVPTWVYPSPQQFYNALVRKGWKTPEEHVEAMVLIHNKLNEDAWTDLLRWEARYGGG